jgi:protein TonB
MTAAPQPTEGPAQTAAAAPRRATLAAAPAAAELLAPLRTRAVTAAAPPPVLAAPAPAAAPATTPAARLVVPIPGTDRAPDYPLAARRRGQAGTVVVLVHCDRDGAVQQLQVLRSSGHALLDAAALAAVRHWRFANGPGQCEQPVTFVLRS